MIQGELSIDLLNVAFDGDDELLKQRISHFVSSLVGEYHYVVVDMPNDMNEVVLETLTQSDLVHLVAYDRRKDLELTRKVIDQLQSHLKENFKDEKVKVVLRGLHDRMYLSFEEIDRMIDYSVYTMLPFIDASELKEDVDCKSLKILRCDKYSGYAKVIRRLAREIGGVLVGLVLGGGAALGGGAHRCVACFRGGEYSRRHCGGQQHGRLDWWILGRGFKYSRT